MRSVGERGKVDLLCFPLYFRELFIPQFVQGPSVVASPISPFSPLHFRPLFLREIGGFVCFFFRNSGFPFLEAPMFVYK